MGNNKKSKTSSNGNRPRNGGSRAKSPLLAKDARNGAPTSRSKTADTHLRTYSIPDTRLEHPDLIVRQAIEKDKDGAEHVRYEVSGNLNAPVPPIRDSKYLDKKQCTEIYPTCCSTARWRSRSKIST